MSIVWAASGYLYGINSADPGQSFYSNDPFAEVFLDITNETTPEIINLAGPQLNALLPNVYPLYGITSFTPYDSRKVLVDAHKLNLLYFHHINYDGTSNIDNLYLSYQMTPPS